MTDLNPSTKRHILNSFPHEVEFMTEALLPLFEEMGYETVFNHGPAEEGKDFVLKKINDFNEPEYTGVVVKRGDINNAGSGRSTLAEVKRQVEQTFNIPLDRFGAKGVYVSRVLVVNSGALSKSARDEINSNVTLANRPNLNFISAEKLVPLFDKFYPQLFQFKLPLVAQYLSDLLSMIEKITSIDPNFSSNLSMLNLKCRKDSVGSDQRFGSEKRESEDIAKKGGFYWLKGGTGSGKTYTVYKIASRSLSLLENCGARAKEIKDPSWVSLPIYCTPSQLKDTLEKEKSKNFADILFSIAKSYSRAITRTDFDSWCQKFHMCLVVDEFEQVKDARTVNGAIDLRTASQTQPSIFLMSRELDESKFEFSRPPEIWRLLDLNLNTLKSTLRAAIPEENQKSLALYKDLAEQGIWERIPRTPLALKVLRHVFSENLNSTPSNTYEFFDMFFELTLGRWEPRRDTFQPLDYKQVRHFLQRVALMMVQSESRSAPIMMLLPIANEVLASVNESEMSAREFIIKVAQFGEVATIRDETFAFTQRTFQEFLAGCEYAQYEWNHSDILNKLTDVNWEDCLVFAAGSRARDNELLELLPTIKEENHSNLFFKLKNIALIVQSLYQSTPESKKIALKSGLACAHKLHDDANFSAGIKNILKNEQDINVSLLVLRLFASFYGRSNLLPILDSIPREDLSDRDKAYLFVATIEDLENLDKEQEEKLVSQLPTKVEFPETLAIAPYLKIEQKYNPTHGIKQLLDDKRIRKLAAKTIKQLSSDKPGFRNRR